MERREANTLCQVKGTGVYRWSEHTRKLVIVAWLLINTTNSHSSSKYGSDRSPQSNSLNPWQQIEQLCRGRFSQVDTNSSNTRVCV